jgi:hypothetical protein
MDPARCAHPGEGLEQGGFAGARRTYHGNEPSSRDRHVEVADQHASPRSTVSRSIEYGAGPLCAETGSWRGS